MTKERIIELAKKIGVEPERIIVPSRRRFNPPDLIAIMPGLSAIFCIYGAIENYIEGRWLEVATLLACVSVSLVAVAVILKYTRRGG